MLPSRNLRFKTTWGYPLLIVIFSVVATWEIVVACRYSRSHVSETDWKRVGAYLNERVGPGDLVVCQPEWLDPLCRKYLQDVITLDMLVRPSNAGYHRLWTVEYDAQQGTFGPLAVASTQLAPSEVLYRFSSVKPHSIEEVEFSPRRCLSATLFPGREKIYEFANVPAGKLQVFLGVADVFTRRDIREPALLFMESGSAVLRGLVGVNDGWQRFELDHPGGAVRVRLSTEAKQRKICLEGEVLSD